MNQIPYQNNGGHPRGRVVRLVMQETGTYNVMYNRAYQTNLDNRSLNTIIDRVAQHGINKPAPSLFSGISLNFLSPSVSPESEATIYNGWNERRLKFVLEVEMQNNITGIISYFIQGYTNYPGVSANRSIDPNMLFVVNSISTISRNEIRTPTGTQIREYMRDCSNIIVDSSFMLADNTGYNAPAPQYLMRPTDIYTNMQKNFLVKGFTGSNRNTSYDFRSAMGSKAEKASKENLLPSNYIAKMISSYSLAREKAPYGVNETGIVDTAISEAREDPLVENGFIAAINGEGYKVSNRFTFDALLSFDPNVVNVTNYLALGNTAKGQLHSAGSTAYWNATDRETHAATILSHSITALMLELLISRIDFLSTNHDQFGKMNTTIINAVSLSMNPIGSSIELFKHRLENEILFDLTYGNQESYMLEISSDIYGDTRITISFGSNPPTVYTTPSFCDSLYSPLVTNNYKNLEMVSMDFEMLNNHITEAVSGSNSMYGGIGINEGF